jgi:hypothetical protein
LAQRPAGSCSGCSAGHYPYPRAQQVLQFYLEPHQIKVVTIGACGYYKFTAVLAEPDLAQTMLGSERFDQPSSPAQRLIVSQWQIHPPIISDPYTNVEHDRSLTESLPPIRATNKSQHWVPVCCYHREPQPKRRNGVSTI